MRRRGKFKHRGRPGEWGGRYLTPNAHRCLDQFWKTFRVSLRSLKAAIRWQIEGY